MKKHAASYLMVASLLAFVSCSTKTDSEALVESTTEGGNIPSYPLTKKQFESSEMELGKLSMRSFHQIVRATGVFDVPPESRASVSSNFEGTVKDIRLLPGEQVKKGQLLFTLENPHFVEMQQDFLAAKGQLKYLKSDYERQKTLAKDNISSQKNYLKAESDYIVTKVKVEALGKKLSLLNINPNTLTLDNIRTVVSVISPIKGFVTHVDITRGSFLNPTESAVTIVDTDHLHLELNVFEKDFLKVDVGQHIAFHIQEDANDTYAATVHLVNKTIDPTSRSIGIHAHLLDETLSSRFSTGMYIEANIYSDSVSKPSLPEDTIVDIEGKYYVLCLQKTSDEGYDFSRKRIEVGKSNNGYVEILNPNDFTKNTQFLTKGAFNLITE